LYYGYGRATDHILVQLMHQMFLILMNILMMTDFLYTKFTKIFLEGDELSGADTDSDPDDEEEDN
jgi:hypothetical protein